MKVDTHSTHFELGEGRGDFVTTSMASTGQAHPERGLVPSRKDWRKLLGGGGEGKAAPRARPRDGVQLGSDKVEYFRAHRDDFAWPEGEQVQGEWRVLCGVWRECECECECVCMLSCGACCAVSDGAAMQRQSNIQLGEEGEGGAGSGTVSGSAYKGLQGERAVAARPSRGSGLYLGDGGGEWGTDAQRAYQWKEGEGAGSQADVERRAGIMRDVRATHFQLGDDGRSFTTTARELESKGVEGGAGVKAAGPRRGSGLHLGSDGSSYSTTNAMPAHEAGAGAVAVKVDTHSTHFELGADREDFITTRMADMKQTHPDHSKFIPPKTEKWKALAAGKASVRGLRV